MKEKDINYREELGRIEDEPLSPVFVITILVLELIALSVLGFAMGAILLIAIGRM